MKAALFCHNGLGDGINSLVLSHNLFLKGWQIDTYHNHLSSMQNWVPHLPIYPYPPLSAIPEILERYDFFFVVENKSSSWIATLIAEGKRRFPERMKVFYLYPSKHIVDEPFYSDTRIEPFMPVAENMKLFCQRILQFSQPVGVPGLRAPTHLQHRAYPRRLILHPTSGKVERTWPREKFVKLALQIRAQGYDVIVIPGEEEFPFWKRHGFSPMLFPTLDQLAAYLFESGYLIGNDSGPGHLASALGIPTLSLFNRYKAASFWRPSFTRGIVVAPSLWIPNVGGLRWRDRYWQRWVTVHQVFRQFLQLTIK